MNVDNIEKLYQYLPTEKIDWEKIEKEILHPFADDLAHTPQEPKWHNEGDVLTHTKMVCETLICLDEYKKLDKLEQLIVFLGCLFHDIGKINCTRVVDGQITSIGHPLKGSMQLREYLWKDLSLCGTKKDQQVRETLCFLVKYHSVPIWELNNQALKRLIKISLNQELTNLFNLKLLTILAKADVLGRISDSKEEHLDNISIFIQMAKELDCYDKPFKFCNAYTKQQYFKKEDMWYYQSLYDPTWKEVILLCGLPGTGKDTYINKYYKNSHVISLDDIREELDVKPIEDQGKVVSVAINKAKEFLREKTPFIWNATNLTNMVRNKLLELFNDYQAKVKIIFLETSYKNNVIRNKNRQKVVDEKVIHQLLAKINMPESYEAQEVEWIIV